MQTGESPIRILFGINRDFDLCSAELLHHRIEILHAEINHPLTGGISEILTVLRKWGKHSRASLLRPGRVAVIRRDEVDAQMLLVPRRDGCRIFGAEEQTANSSYTLIHARRYSFVCS